MSGSTIRYTAAALITALTCAAMVSHPSAHADPCGMVPPIYTGDSPITRSGLQQTYVFHRDGVESFVIRPGYEGNVDNFGMLIPFPTPPSIRKVHDDVFEQIKNAIDPPEVVVDLLPKVEMMMMRAGGAVDAADGLMLKELADNEVVVLRQEAVGMYEVAVLAAGSAEVLKNWMDENGYQFPEGMDDVAGEYIEEDWCFVAVKTKVSAKDTVDPVPGQRAAEAGMPEGSVFDGHVQGLAFRFASEELVVPMRLSAFNEGDTRNVVYLLTESGKRIRNIPEEYVRRQLSGRQLVDNITGPLPLRVIGGTLEDIPEGRAQSLEQERDPRPFNGIAARLFVSDILASQMDQQQELLLDDESAEKSLVNINERLMLRGAEIDDLVVEAMNDRFASDEEALEIMRSMTLTVVDGDFPRQVLAGQNLRFADYRMAAALNTPQNYDTRLNGPGQEAAGNLYLGALSLPGQLPAAETQVSTAAQTTPVFQGKATLLSIAAVLLISTALWKTARYDSA
ncbi:MAG: DUF2330 domain-containing protein [Planctomycetota bacterium]